MKTTILIIAALCALLCSCHTMEGVGRDMQKAGGALERTASH